MPNPCPLHPHEPGKALPFVPIYGPPGIKGKSGIWQCNALMGFNPDGTPVKGADKTGRCKFMWDPAAAPVLPSLPPLATAEQLSKQPLSIGMELRVTTMGMALHGACLVHQDNLGPTENIIAMTKRFYFELLEAAALGTLEP